MIHNLLFIAALQLSPAARADELKDSVPLPMSGQAELKAKAGTRVKGIVQFTEATEGLQVRYKISGLEKGKKYGFHIHEKGDCSSADFKSAGPHYKKMEAGGGTSKDNPDRYAGDMPSIEADATGKAEGTTSLSNGLTKLLDVKDHAVILHAGPDDINKPSAPRIACGVIMEQRVH
jgi:Cu-Zn family superoxide dismutase